jgi:membrane-bound ClpP family serine protease
MVSALGGHHEFGGHEVSLDHDHDVGHDVHGDGDGDASPSFLSVRILSLFAVAFGAVGVIGTAKELPGFLTLLISTLSGGGIGYAGLRLMRLFWSQQASSTVGANEFLAQYGEVHTEIPSGGFGEISVVIRGQRFYIPARTKGGIPIPQGSRVFIAQHDGTRVVVESMEERLIDE